MFGVCMLKFDIYKDTAPSYILELSVAHGDIILRTRLHFTDGSITVAGPKVWNAPLSRLHTLACKDTFHSPLKTHFFNQYFN